MFVQVIHIFEHVAFHGTRDSNIIDQASIWPVRQHQHFRTCFKKNENTRLKWITYSQSPTPPACGQTGTPNLSDGRDVSRAPKPQKTNPLCCHEEYAEHLADARETTRVYLTDVYRLRLEQLLEHHPVMRVLARRDADSVRLERATDRSVPEDVIRSRRLLNEPEKKKKRFQTETLNRFFHHHIERGPPTRA